MLHDYYGLNKSTVADDDDDADDTAMCTAVRAGTVWPRANLVSLWRSVKFETPFPS